MAGTRACDGRPLCARCIRRRVGRHMHRALPVFPILVGNHERDRRARCDAAPDTARGLRPVRLDGHAASAAVAALPPAQLRGHRVEIDREAGRNAFEDRDERLTMRLAGGEKSQHSSHILSEKIAAPGRAHGLQSRDRERRRSCSVCGAACGGRRGTARRSLRHCRRGTCDRSRHRRSCRAAHCVGRRAQRSKALGSAMRQLHEDASAQHRATRGLRWRRRNAAVRSLAMR